MKRSVATVSVTVYPCLLGGASAVGSESRRQTFVTPGSTEKNKDLVRRYYEEVVSTGRIDEVDRFVSPDYVEVHEDERHAVGIGGAKAHILGVRQTYAGLRLTVEQQIAEGEWVVSRVKMRGTHHGEWLGIEPTGKPVEMSAVNIDRVKGGLIVEHGGAANLLEPLLAIGAVRVVGKSDP